MNRFDELAKALAGSATRRQALRAIAGGLLASLGLGQRARADYGWGEACQEFCKSIDARPLGRCVNACVACLKVGGHPCDVDQCCFGTELCCGGDCISCPQGTMLDPETCMCVRVGCRSAADCPPAPDQCHIGVCLAGICNVQAAPNGTPCDDGNACTQTDFCIDGVCVGSNPVVCTASDQCHVAGTCDPSTGLCSNPAAANGTACNDGNACTQTDTCQAGVCVGSNPVICGSFPCFSPGVCDPDTGMCNYVPLPDGTPCNPGVGQGTCQLGNCLPTP
jgi:hypothetical protein